MSHIHLLNIWLLVNLSQVYDVAMQAVVALHKWTLEKSNP